MKNVYELEKAVTEYCNRHGRLPKYTKCYPDDMYYSVSTFDYTDLEAQIIPCKNGKTKTVFKVDGKLTFPLYT